LSRERFTPEKDKMEEKVLKVNRVSKTVKGGRKISFSVLVAVGDGEGQVGIGLGKANSVPDAMKKGAANARKNIIKVSLKGNTIPHDVDAKFNATNVFMKPATEGTGVIAGSAVREILELVGVQNILTKVRGSRCKINIARATIAGLQELRTAEEIAKLRGKTVQEILS
jgi:small subunit ribosomal protein S5